MSLFFKNSSSYSPIIVSEGILQYLLMLIMALWWVIPALYSSQTTSKGVVLVELEDYMGPNDAKALISQFKSDKSIIPSTVTYISKEEAISIMANEVDSQLLNQSEKENPFRDVVRFEIASEISQEDIMTKAGVHEIYIENNRGSSSLIKRLSLNSSIPLTIVTAILFFTFIKMNISNLITENKRQITSLAHYGADHKTLAKGLQQFTNQASFRAWFIAIFLFVCTFYLLLGILDTNISNISVIKVLLCTVIALVITLIIKRWMLSRKFAKTEL